jgi:hypothetical protein
MPFQLAGAEQLKSQWLLIAVLAQEVVAVKARLKMI